ncbi:hypothetical protein JW921_04530 [Candidatus Fermentibacterales bacterium]|nr:hypothetical protein [Candidatus Fermentibacterales bacterium]
MAMACVLFLLPLSVVADSHELDSPLSIAGFHGGFQYDDGTAYWLTWDGTYRGTWFDAEDFIPGVPGVTLHELEFWFYHHSSYPWDTASFMGELWNGGISMPADSIDANSVTAVHYAPCYVDYGYPGPGVSVDTQWWIVINTEMSAGGWPSTLGDNTPQVLGDHSFFSDSFTVWEPWVIQGPTANDFFIRCDGYIGLDESTWGSLKTLF